MGRYLLLAKEIEAEAPSNEAPYQAEHAETVTLPELPDLEPGATHAVYFTYEDGSTERVSRTRIAADAPCIACGRRAWWRSIHDALVCGVCHPPACPELVAEWLGDHDA